MQLHYAHKIANELVAHLAPHCIRIQVAGSIRRQVAEVNDIELVLEPKRESETDLFGNVTKQVRDRAFVMACDAIGEKVRGQASDGRYVRYMVNGTTLEVDIFIPQPHDYYRILAIRTGSSLFAHKQIAAGWLKKGWCGTTDGLRLQSECVGTPNTTGGTTWKCVAKAPKLPPVWESEEAFFTWLGLPFLNPKNRV